MEENFLKALEPLVSTMVNYLTKYGAMSTNCGKKLKNYNESIKILKSDLTKDDDIEGGHLRIQSNIRAFRKLIKKLDSRISVMAEENDYDDWWIRLKSETCDIIYTKNETPIPKLAIHFSEIYPILREVKERYELMILIFGTFLSVCDNKTTLKKLKVIIARYKTKIEGIPEEEALCASNSDDEDEMDMGGEKTQNQMGKTIRGVLGQFGLNEKSLEKIVAMGGGGDNDDDDESDDEKGEDKKE